MDKKSWLDNLHYNSDAQQGNLEVSYLNKNNPKRNTKWRKYLNVQADEPFLEKVNNRSILPNEVVLDIEESESFPQVLERVKKDLEFYSAYNTGSRGYHIHLWFNRPLTSDEKKTIIVRYGADIQKAADRCLIALENCPHWKTGNPKTLIEGVEGINSFKMEEKFESNTKDNFIELIYFDSHGLFWIWSEENNRWEFKDDIDVLNLFEDNGWETKKAKNKSYILNLAKQEGRKNKPLELPEYSICFMNCFYDLLNKKEIPITKKYFITSPIPHELGTDGETPTIDKFFAEWVGEDYMEMLYELMAYSCMNEQPLQTIFALTGAGSNGKGTFQNLSIKFIGKDNCVSSSVKSLITRNFETSALYRKLLCVMGEADSSDLSNSNLIKQFTGEDLMRYEFKGKTSFSEPSPTTFILATNSLPITPDKSIGFYRRWLIIDFPNQFKVKRNLLNEIPEREFKNLGRKIVNAAIRLLEKEEFTNGGTFEERRERYEERSNPITQFLIHNYVEDGIGFVKLREFSKNLNYFLRNKKLRVLTVGKIGKLLRDEGFEISTRKFRDESGEIVDSAKSIIGISEKLMVSNQVAENSGLGGLENEIKPLEQPKFATGCYICEKQAVLINKYQIPYCEYCYQEDYKEYLPKTIAPASLIGITIQKPPIRGVA